ncbi:hypothetical protein AUEXF2481DRAFT_352871 [Aureobasidium subglaciale EXF-2481]|uniref:Uncharacterized protein n=1 Tax=Aureobasidium subglaciale (strain EXF-2481) TaxID=1043005 RepID=A0A074Z250_AURSE|nr:uncharacterized protein AUEXF2481DRAFT_352871 [Aureobasidium subglaciale EXF-2481]KEQ93106.1 hypothetical protein AUEXF2481DRAFT_352871 [Aureobasidium subglaciale EXF-2481]
MGDSLTLRCSRARHDRTVMAQWEQQHPSRLEGLIVRPYILNSGPRASTSYHTSSIASLQGYSVVGNRASSYRPSSTASENVPSLNHSFSTMSTRTIDTNKSSGSSSTNMSGASQAGTLQCTFAFLGCREEFSSTSTWRTHCTSHFRSQPSPNRSQCPFCSSQWSSSSAWKDRLDHIAIHHREERIETRYRPDYDLFRHLLRFGVISFPQYQELERRGRCDGVGAVYLETNNSRRERREGGPRGWTSYPVGG